MWKTNYGISLKKVERHTRNTQSATRLWKELCGHIIVEVIFEIWEMHTHNLQLHKEGLATCYEKVIAEE